MRTLDPNDPEDLKIILGYLIEDEIDSLGIEQAYQILYETNRNKLEPKGLIGPIGSQEEVNCLFTDFHFSQQIIFDYYEIIES